jgi:hypothetical protein
VSRAAVLQQQAPARIEPGPPTLGPDYPLLDPEYAGFCDAEAVRRGISPYYAEKVAWSEGGLDEPALRGTFATGSSWWAYQLHYGGRGYEWLGTSAGMGNGFTELTGWEPGDPRAWRDAMRYALDRARAAGWGDWYGARAQGITGFAGIDRSSPWSGTPAEAWDYRRPQLSGDDLRALVLAAGMSRIGDPYVWGGHEPPGLDCSGFVAWAYRAILFPLTAFTDRMYGETLPLLGEVPRRGDPIFYEYDDPGQPGVRFPHMGLVSDWPSRRTLEARYPQGVAIYARLGTDYEVRRVPGT